MKIEKPGVGRPLLGPAKNMFSTTTHLLYSCTVQTSACADDAVFSRPKILQYTAFCSAGQYRAVHCYSYSSAGHVVHYSAVHVVHYSAVHVVHYSAVHVGHYSAVHVVHYNEHYWSPLGPVMPLTGESLLICTLLFYVGCRAVL